MDDLAWSLEQDLLLEPDHVFRCLKRAVDNVDEFEKDLAPFESLPALWIVEGLSTRPREQGVLRRFVSVSRNDEFLVDFLQSGLASLRVDAVAERELTVWRYCGALEMIQVRVMGAQTGLYAQLGGGRMLAA